MRLFKFKRKKQDDPAPNPAPEADAPAGAESADAGDAEKSKKRGRALPLLLLLLLLGGAAYYLMDGEIPFLSKKQPDYGDFGGFSTKAAPGPVPGTKPAKKTAAKPKPAPTAKAKASSAKRAAIAPKHPKPPVAAAPSAAPKATAPALAAGPKPANETETPVKKEEIAKAMQEISKAMRDDDTKKAAEDVGEAMGGVLSAMLGAMAEAFGGDNATGQIQALVKTDGKKPTGGPSFSASPLPGRVNPMQALRDFQSMLLYHVGYELSELSKEADDVNPELRSFSAIQDLKRRNEILTSWLSAKKKRIQSRMDIVKALLNTYRAVNETLTPKGGGEMAQVIQALQGLTQQAPRRSSPPPQSASPPQAAAEPKKAVKRASRAGSGEVLFAERDRVYLRDGSVVKLRQKAPDGYVLQKIDLERGYVIFRKGKAQKKVPLA